MKTRAILALTAAAGLAGVANAQSGSVTSDSTINVTLTAAEVGNGNGIIDQGESVLFTMNVSFTNQNGIANFNPTIGTFGSGTIRGFGSGFFDVNSSASGNSAVGTWNTDPNGSPAYGLDPAWDLAGREGTGANGGANLQDIEPGQFPPNPTFINTANPVSAIWTGLWTPGAAAFGLQQNNVTWQIAGNPAAGTNIASVMLKLSNQLAAGVFVDAQHLSLGSAQVTLAAVPAPSSLALLGLGGLIAGRRRRR